eukprot:symbB.v1.2.008228.t1/scaffold497.1/size195672/10
MRGAARSAKNKALLSRRSGEEACGIAISVLQKKRQWQKALELFEDFKSTGIPSTAKLWNAALGAACAGAAWRIALDLFNTARADWTTVDVSTYTAAMTAMVRAKRCKEGLEIFESMDLDKADMPALLLGIRLYSELGHHEAALGLKTGGTRTHVEIYNALLSASSRGRKDTSNKSESISALEVVQDLLLEMRQVRLTLTRVSYGAALQAFGKYGAWAEALQLLREMASKKMLPDVQAYTCGINACGRAGRWLHAMQLLDGAHERGLVDHQLQNALLSALGRASLWQAALLELEDLNYRSTVSWNASITACAEAAEWTIALALLSRTEFSSPLVRLG